MIEQSIVFNDDGSPKEIRFYDDYELVSRLGFIKGENGNFIGTRQLSIDGVVGYQKPRNIFRRKQKVQPDQTGSFIQSSIVALMASNDFKTSTYKILDSGDPVSFNVGQLTNVDTTVYTVPGLRTFYMLGLDLDVAVINPMTPGFNNSYIYFNTATINSYVIASITTGPNRLSGHTQNSLQFRFPSGFALHVFADVNVVVSASILGVLVRER